MKAWIAMVMGGLVACGGAPAPAPAPSKTTAPSVAPDVPLAERTALPVTRRTQNGKYTVEVSFDPAEPAMGALFTAQAKVLLRDGTAMEAGEVVLNATMPHHGHGMMTDPKELPGTCDDDGACTHPEGLFRTEGFKFHMPGEWTVTVQVVGPEGPDSTSFVYVMP